VVRVKICGLTRKEDLIDAIDAGADAVGFIFGYDKSPRNLSFDSLTELVPLVPPYVSSVVVTPPSNPELSRVIGEVRPSFLQLYSADSTREFFPNVIETVHVSGEETILISKERSKMSKGILLDSAGDTKMPGGSGVSHDWAISRKIRDALYPFPVILGGGLNVANIGEALSLVKPFAVDVSSGVELKPGIKDKLKVREFIERAKVW
jgi:phosphoribosylanthranilate isomerase